MNESRAKPKILAVDDKPQNLHALEKLLVKLPVEVVQTTSGFEALSLTLEHDFCLAIVDIQMPEMDGYELVELLRGNPDTTNLPVIFVSAIYSDEYHHRKGYDAGAVDFMSKPFVPEILLSKVMVFLDLYYQRNKLEDLIVDLKTEIKQRHQVETALRQANDDKDKLFSIISHDLRNPFQILLGNTEFMLETLEDLSKTDIRDMANSIYRSAKSASILLDNLLTWSRLQRGHIEHKPGPIKLHQLADSTIALLGEMALGKDIQLENTIEAELIAHADKYMIDTVIRNLASNALKFTPAEGRVTLSAHQNGGSVGNGDTGMIEVSVTDTGIGISQEDIDKLFKSDVHHTTLGTAKETGTGLGLMLCQEMVERNGGRIWVESEPNQGTTVRFIVPAKSTAYAKNQGF